MAFPIDRNPVKDEPTHAQKPPESDFERLLDSFLNNKVTLTLLQNCELVFICKTCRRLFVKLENYGKHFERCDKRNIINHLGIKTDTQNPIGDVNDPWETRRESPIHSTADDGGNNSHYDSDVDIENEIIDGAAPNVSYITEARISFDQKLLDDNDNGDGNDYNESKFCTDIQMNMDESEYSVTLNDECDDMIDLNRLVCFLCDKVCSSSFKLRRHFAVIHLGISRYKCKSCDYKSSSVTECKDHSMATHGVQVTKWNLVDFYWDLICRTPSVIKRNRRGKDDNRGAHRKLTSAKIPESHSLTNDVEESNICHIEPIGPSCQMGGLEMSPQNLPLGGDDNGKYYVDLSDDYKPMVDVRKKACLLCRKSFTSAFKMMQHVAVAHFGHSRYKCKLCEFKSSSSSECKRHALVVHKRHLDWANHAALFWVVSCRTPNFRKRGVGAAGRKARRKVHNRGRAGGSGGGSSGDGGGDLICLHCGALFSSAYSLRRHTAVAHLGFKAWRCKFCSFQADLKDFHDHMAACHGEETRGKHIMQLVLRNSF